MKKQMKQIGILTLGVLMLASVMALYSGECGVPFETDLTNPVYTVVGNSTTLEGLEVTFENGNLTVCTDKYMPSDNFTILFFDELTNEVTNTIYTGGGGGGGSTTKYVDRNVTVYEPEYITTIEEVEVITEVPGETIIEAAKANIWLVIGGTVAGFLIALAIVFIFGGKKEYQEEASDDTSKNT